LEFGSFQKRNKGPWQESSEHNGNGPRGNVKTLKINGSTKTSQLQDELPEWYHRTRGDISEGEIGCEGWAIRRRNMKTDQPVKDNLKILKEFAAAVSTQAQVTNRIWLGLMTVAVVALLPANAGTAKLPLILGEVDAQTFSWIVYSMLVVLTIAFSSAYAEQFRAQSLAHKFLNSISKENVIYGETRFRRWFDLLRLPTFNRVAPLTQFLPNRSTWVVGTIRVAYYLVLKVIATGLYFGLPGYALYHAYTRILPVVSHRWILATVTTFAALTLGQGILGDVVSLRDVVPKIWNGDTKS
jgi:hypothetical protein